MARPLASPAPAALRRRPPGRPPGASAAAGALALHWCKRHEEHAGRPRRRRAWTSPVLRPARPWMSSRSRRATSFGHCRCGRSLRRGRSCGARGRRERCARRAGAGAREDLPRAAQRARDHDLPLRPRRRLRIHAPEVLPRVAAALWSLVPEGAAAGPLAVVELPVPASELSALGIAPESFSRAVTKLVSLRVLHRLGPRRFQVLDPRGLRSVAGADGEADAMPLTRRTASPAHSAGGFSKQPAPMEQPELDRAHVLAVDQLEETGLDSLA